MFLHCSLILFVLQSSTPWKWWHKGKGDNLRLTSCWGYIPSNDEIQILVYLPKNALGRCLGTTGLHRRQSWKQKNSTYLNINIKARQSSLTQLTILSPEENFSITYLYYKLFSIYYYLFSINKKFLKKVLLSVLNPTILTTFVEHMLNPWCTYYCVKCWQHFSLQKTVPTGLNRNFHFPPWRKAITFFRGRTIKKGFQIFRDWNIKGHIFPIGLTSLQLFLWTKISELLHQLYLFFSMIISRVGA